VVEFEMSEFLVDCINKPHRQSPHEHITHIGRAGGWRMERDEAIRRIDAKQDEFYTIDASTSRKVYIGWCGTTAESRRTCAHMLMASGKTTYWRNRSVAPTVS